MCLHRAGSSDLEAAAQDVRLQSQRRDRAGAAAALELQLRGIARNHPSAAVLLHSAKTSLGPALEQGNGRGLLAAGHASSQDQEQLARAKLHSGWWQQLAAAGVADPLPRGGLLGQPSLGQASLLIPRSAGVLSSWAARWARGLVPLSHMFRRQRCRAMSPWRKLRRKPAGRGSLHRSRHPAESLRLVLCCCSSLRRAEQLRRAPWQGCKAAWQRLLDACRHSSPAQRDPKALLRC